MVQFWLWGSELDGLSPRSDAQAEKLVDFREIVLHYVEQQIEYQSKVSTIAWEFAWYFCIVAGERWRCHSTVYRLWVRERTAKSVIGIDSEEGHGLLCGTISIPPCRRWRRHGEDCFQSCLRQRWTTSPTACERALRSACAWRFCHASAGRGRCCRGGAGGHAAPPPPAG